MRRTFVALTVTLLAACATLQNASFDDTTLPYGCNDTVVVGTVTNGNYEPVKSHDDILGHGWISATLHVQKLVRGQQLPPVLPGRKHSLIPTCEKTKGSCWS